MATVKLANTADVPEGEARRFAAANGEEVCVVNLGTAGYRAIGAVCSHQHAWLDEGEIEVQDQTIECPLHGSAFDLNTGAAKSLPAFEPVPSYPVVLEGDTILIEVNDD